MIFGKGMFSTSKEVQLDMDTYLLYNDPETSLLYYRTTQSQGQTTQACILLVNSCAAFLL